MAARFGLGTEQSGESQEICFIPDNDYAAVLEYRCPELVRAGEIVDSSGKVLAEHRGVHRFTIGQRRGLGVAMGEPYYVVNIDARTNTVTLGPKEEAMHKRLQASGANWLIETPDAGFRARVKIRYNDTRAPATVTPRAGGVVVVFDEPNLAITPGQLAVFYIKDKVGSRVAGGAWIDSACD
jgi:tRNA-specific 2-thiouridylase